VKKDNYYKNIKIFITILINIFTNLMGSSYSSNRNDNFIHFGCWNNKNCLEDSNSFKINSMVLKKINLKKYDFISVAGDNYYPDKIKNESKDENIVIKRYNDKNFTNGFNCLPDDIKKYIIFGNHDIMDEMEGIENCGVLKSTQLLESKNKNMIIFNNVLHIFQTNTLIIFIDSTLYDIKNKDQLINDTCYRHFFSDFKGQHKTLRDLIDYQNATINEIIEKILTDGNTITNLIFIAHHPLFSIRTKLDKHTHESKPKITGIFDFINIFEDITNKDRLKQTSFYYLCADTHLYQHGNIKFSNGKIVKQYIVGTGGAEFDNGSFEGKEDPKKIIKETITGLNDSGIHIISYEIKEEIINKYGFITVNYKDPNNITIQFIDSTKIINDNPAVYYGDPYDISPEPNLYLESYYITKYKKYKNKYLALKK
jgi:hypothetical protein